MLHPGGRKSLRMTYPSTVLGFPHYGIDIQFLNKTKSFGPHVYILSHQSFPGKELPEIRRTGRYRA